MTGLFASYSPLCSLTVGGKTIRTTAEHPFWVKGRGWRHAHQIESGDELRAEDGRWLAVEAVTGNEGAEPVYNVVVEEYHTYFVGEGTWGFAVWAHNAKCDRFQGDKPAYIENPAHLPATLRPGKTRLPGDARQVYGRAVPDASVGARHWYEKNANGDIYRFSNGGNNTAHFSGIDGVGDGIRNITPYARNRLKRL